MRSNAKWWIDRSQERYVGWGRRGEEANSQSVSRAPGREDTATVPQERGQDARRECAYHKLCLVCDCALFRVMRLIASDARRSAMRDGYECGQSSVVVSSFVCCFSRMDKRATPRDPCTQAPPHHHPSILLLGRNVGAASLLEQIERVYTVVHLWCLYRVFLFTASTSPLSVVCFSVSVFPFLLHPWY